MSDDDDDDLSALTNVDPSVAALLEPLPDDQVTQSLLRTRIAMMKLQQARIRGNSDYAAKIMDHAIEEGARDRTAWTLLDQHITKLDQQVAAIAQEKNYDTVTKEEKVDGVKDDDNKMDTEQKEEGENNNENKDSEATPEEVKKLTGQLAEETERANALEQLLVDCLQEEIGSVIAEQASLRDREERLKARIRSLELAMKNLPPTSTTHLQDMLKEARENQCILVNAQCSVCHEQSATRAVIPCGHLALCDACTKTITTLDSSQRHCPLCRGHLLSTLHIYNSK
jgi:chromosome segregation ATPase